MTGPLDGVRVLEVADERGEFLGKLLADHGADVVKVEPPDGERTRRLGPFLKDQPGADRSLWFWHYNTSKRGITLDLATDAGRDRFAALAGHVDVVIEAKGRGYLDALGLGFERLVDDHPNLVFCALTDFGQTGPWADYRGGELVHFAAGGQMASCGYDERDAPPIAPGGGNAHHTGAHYAYLAIVAALLQREVTGAGQFIDASIHDACALSTESAMASYIYRGEVVERRTGRHHSTEPTPPTQFRCKDGRYLNALIAGDPKALRVLAEWMDEYGMAGDLLDERYAERAAIRANYAEIIAAVGTFVSQLTADEAYHGGQARGFTWGAVRSIDEVMEDQHLVDRGFWVDVHHEELDATFTYPGSGGIYGESPWRISRRAPLLGEHNGEILGSPD